MRKLTKSIFPLVLSFVSSASPAANLLSASRALPQGAFAATENAQELTLLESGIASFRKRLLMIESAKKNIDTEYYIYKTDQSGRLYTQALIKKARQGVRVRVLVDMGFGNENINPLDAQAMSENGIEVRYYNKVPLLRFSQANHRSHRKSLIVDGVEAVIGGRNLGDDYFDFSPEYDMLDRDVVVRGTIVRDISKSFENFWNSRLSQPVERVTEPQLIEYGLQSESEANTVEGGRSTLERYQRDHALYMAQWKNARSLLVTTAEDVKSYDRVRYYGDQFLAIAPKSICRETYYYADIPGKNGESRVVQDQMRNLLLTAKKSLVVESPFFIQNEAQNMFQQALERGVKVDILTNSLYSSDVALSVAPFVATAKTLTAYGANVFVFEGDSPRWLEHSNHAAKTARWGTHAKGIVIDDESILIGSFNMDPRSANLNAEMALVCRGNKDLAAAMNLDMERRKSIAVKLDRNGDPVDGRSKFFNVDANKKFLYYLTKPLSYLMQGML